MKEAAIIVARARNGVIGDSHTNQIPWVGQLPTDMDYFQRLTIGHAVLMGRKTYESLLPHLRPLKGRINGILSRDLCYNSRANSTRPDYDSNEVVLADSFEDLLQYCLGRLRKRTFIIGGGEIYRLALAHPHVTQVYITEVDADFPGDVTFPDLDPTQWELAKSWAHPPFDKNLYPFRWDVYRRVVHE